MDDILKRLPSLNDGVSVPKMKFELPTIPTIDHQVLSQIDIHTDALLKSNQEKNEREIENNESLKQIVEYNSQLVSHNEQLVEFNKSILKKINAISNSMDSVINSMGANAQNLERIGNKHTELFFNLISIMEDKEQTKSNKLADFLKDLTGDVAVGLITEYFKYKMGLS